MFIQYQHNQVKNKNHILSDLMDLFQARMMFWSNTQAGRLLPAQRGGTHYEQSDVELPFIAGPHSHQKQNKKHLRQTVTASF